MTATDELRWDAAQNAVADALADLVQLAGMVPDAAPYTATRNRIAMAQTALDDAIDYLAAARARMPDTET